MRLDPSTFPQRLAVDQMPLRLESCIWFRSANVTAVSRREKTPQPRRAPYQQFRDDLADRPVQHFRFAWSRDWKNRSGPRGSARPALPPRPLRCPRRLEARMNKFGGYRKVQAGPWQTASRGRGVTMSSSSCGGRTLLMITNSCAATPRDSWSLFQRRGAGRFRPAPRLLLLV
jgi:hypothetical protein